MKRRDFFRSLAGCAAVAAIPGIPAAATHTQLPVNLQRFVEGIHRQFKILSAEVASGSLAFVRVSTMSEPPEITEVVYTGLDERGNRRTERITI